MSLADAFEGLLDQADPAATVVTSTHRLARVVREAHDRRALASGAKAWQGIDVLPADAWLHRLWSDALARGCVDARALLSGVQEQAIWEGLVGDLRGGARAGAERPLARLAADAWRALRESGSDERALAGEPGADPAHVARCLGAFRHRVESDGWIDAASLASTLAAVPLERLVSPEAVVLAGFDRVSPALESLLDALRRAGGGVGFWSPEPLRGDAWREIYPTPVAEVYAAARWARTVLVENPDARIGIVVPDLHARRPDVERAFEEVLLPGQGADVSPGERPFAISLGESLARAAPVADALALLRAATTAVEPGALARLLASPYLAGAASERVSRSAVAQAVRAAGELALDLDGLHALIRRHAPGGSPRLEAALSEVRELLAATPGRRSAGAWAELCWTILLAAGWPGEDALDSVEHQCVQALHDTLASLASLEAVLGPMSARDACQRFAGLCAERVFAPRAESARVEIAGLLETAGQQFTHLRILGMDDVAWPPPARPNPLLPARLQARLGVVQSTPALCLQHAEATTARLLAASPRVVVTHAERHGDEVRRSSPLFAALPVAPVAAESPATGEVLTFSDVLVLASPVLEAIPEPALPLLEEGTFVHGGARVLQDQAACGFRAFARHRLCVKGVEERDSALDASARGALVHRALESVWRELRTHARLVEASPLTRDALVARCVGRALSLAARDRPAIRGRSRQLEQRRLERLVSAWLELECARPPFEVVAPEHDTRIRVGPLELALRPDRIDRLEDGRHLVIDYKTGAATIGAWFGARPDDPQVPLYAGHLVSANGETLEVACGAFGELRAQRLGLRGLGQDAGYADGVSEIATSRYGRAEGVESWHQALEAWRLEHAAIARAFAAGRADVDPKRWPATCRTCEVRALCRIDERRRGSGLDDATVSEAPTG